MFDMDNVITLMNYKEPLKPLTEEQGFGYYGVLSSTEDGGKIQCHLCGELFNNLASHIRWEHNLTVKEYRKEFELARSTALVSEKEREKRKKRMLDWISGLPEEKRKEYQEKRIECLNQARLENNPHGKLSLETKNKRGSCPSQILEKVREISKILDHSPSYQEMIETSGGYRYVRLAVKVFGTWNETLRMANLPNSEGKDKRGRKIYTKEELLEYIKTFFRVNRTVPTASDCRRGLLPHDDTYRKYFGGIGNARKLAGVGLFN